MAHVVLISDVMNNDSHGSSRYMGPYAIAGQLRRAGYEVVVVDYFSLLKSPFQYLRNFIGPETLAIGISCTFLNPSFKADFKWKASFDDSNFYYGNHLLFHTAKELNEWVLSLKQQIRAIAPNAQLFLGGSKASQALDHPDGYRSFDYVCIGAGDETFVNAVRTLQKMGTPSHIEKNGVRLLTADKLKNSSAYCPDAQFLDQDAVQKFESLPIEVSRGCIFNCKFCHYEKKSSVRKEIGSLRSELIRNFENFGTTVYHLTDDCFNDHRAKVTNICEMFLKLPFKIEWITYARVDLAVKFPETLELMIRSGARGLHWGIESFNDEASRRAGKGTPSAEVKKMLLHFQREYGQDCISTGSFITGLPGETRESIEQTIDWLSGNDALHSIVVSPLKITSYVQSLDQAAIDYAEYSRNPSKYGFRSVRFSPDFWAHDEMDSDVAVELAVKFQKSWQTSKGTGPMRTMWRYPHMRSLGFEHKELMSRLRPSVDDKNFLIESENRFQNFVSQYHNLLLSNNTSEIRGNGQERKVSEA